MRTLPCPRDDMTYGLKSISVSVASIERNSLEKSPDPTARVRMARPLGSQEDSIGSAKKAGLEIQPLFIRVHVRELIPPIARAPIRNMGGADV